MMATMPEVPYRPEVTVPYPTDRDHALALLRGVPKLPYKHHSWPMHREVLMQDSANHLARIIGSIGLSCIHAREEDVVRTMELCRESGATIDLQYSPWHHAYDNTPDARGWNASAVEELTIMSDNFAKTKDWILANQVAGDPVGISLSMLDQEAIRADLDENGDPDPAGGQRPDQAAALKEKNDLSYAISKEHFPDVPVMLHGYRATSKRYTPECKNDGIGVTELYQGNQISLQEYKYREFIEACDPYEWIDKYIPAISLAGFYDVAVAEEHPGYTNDIPYAVKYSWHRSRQMWHNYFRALPGSVTNNFSAGYFWSGPFGLSQVGYGWHFLAYVYGAYNHKKFQDNWVDTAVK